MSNEVTTTNTTNNLPATTDYSGVGLEDLSHADTPQKYISLDNGTGKISIHGTDVVLGDTKTAFKITPIYNYSEWQYITPDGASTKQRELVHSKKQNVGLKDEETVFIKDYDGKDVECIRVFARCVLVIVSDRESEGPMILSCRRSKRWAMEATLINKLVENKAKKLPIFGQEFFVTSEQRTNKKNQKFYVYNFKPADLVTDPAKLKAFNDMFVSLRESQDRLLLNTEETPF